MNFNLNLPDINECTGCGACLASCPTHSISMEYNEEGFLYPEISSSCISCRKCEKVCPLLNEPIVVNSVNQEVYCAIHKNDIIWKRSTSGGAFTAICELYGDEDTIVFGAAFDSESKLIKHKWVKGVDNIDIFCGSKYVQSNLGDCFSECAQFLQEKKKVIFSGTPCQIAALINYLNIRKIKIESLLCVDLLCHGVGSPGVFKDYVSDLERTRGVRIRDFSFRNKEISLGRHKLYVARIEYEDGFIKIEENNPFTNLFLQNILSRQSCGICRFACESRYGDITIADYKSLFVDFPKTNPNRNASAIICNTYRGKLIIDKLISIMDTKQSNTEAIRRNNNPFTRPAGINPKRTVFFDEYKSNKCDTTYEVMSRYYKPWTIGQKLLRMIPEFIKGWIKRILRIVRKRYR